MQRREFITSVIGGVAATGLTVAAGSASEQQTTAAGGAPEFYAWQHYILRSGTQQQRVAEFLQEGAAIPALNNGWATSRSARSKW